MPKQLILFRHAKSDWNTSFGNDSDRMLSKRGIKAAAKMGKLLALSNEMPQLAIVSSAVRAISTLELAIEAGKWDCKVEISDLLYLSDIVSVLSLIRKILDKYNKVILVGHEPTWSELTKIFIDGGEFKFPTATMSIIEFNVESWEDVDFRLGSLIGFFQPKYFADNIH